MNNGTVQGHVSELFQTNCVIYQLTCRMKANQCAAYKRKHLTESWQFSQNSLR